jgi:hypothetical protein
MESAMVRGMVEFEAWAQWLRSLDPAWMFLVILLIVVAVVGLWSRSLKSDKDAGSRHE